MIFLPLAFSLNVSIYKRTFQLFNPILKKFLKQSHIAQADLILYVSEAGQEPVILLPPPPKCKDLQESAIHLVL